MIAVLNGAPIEVGELGALALYGYGHFTSLVATDEGVRGLELHLDRLQRDCRALHGSELDRSELRRLIGQAAQQTGPAAILRVTVFDPALDLGRPGKPLHPQILVTARAVAGQPPVPIALTVTEYRRERPEVKHTGLFATVALRREAQLDGFDDIAFCDAEGRLSEGATWNLGFVTADGSIVVPDQPCLPGVTLQLLREALDRRCTPWSRRTITIDDAVAMPAGFITNAAIGIRPMASFNGTALDPTHPRLAELRQIYDDITPDQI